jgi:DNA polymerase delta subunit 1
MIEQTRKKVTEKFCKQLGYEHDSEVIYGDTDSVMVKFGVKTVQEAMALGKEASEFISKGFKKPIKLEFEKVYCPYLLMSKKRYAGLLWTNPDHSDKIDAKGIETVRRDNCPLVKEVINNCLKMILLKRNYPVAIEYAKGVISDLLQNRIDLSLLVITRGLGKNAGKIGEDGKKDIQYHAKQAHVELAEKMRMRDEATAPNPGD